jgi:hypothetical protein
MPYFGTDLEGWSSTCPCQCCLHVHSRGAITDIQEDRCSHSEVSYEIAAGFHGGPSPSVTLALSWGRSSCTILLVIYASISERIDNSRRLLCISVILLMGEEARISSPGSHPGQGQMSVVPQDPSTTHPPIWSRAAGYTPYDLRQLPMSDTILLAGRALALRAQ